ncbi:aconitase/3-isopropylmalate dehydratase large subunit family protein [Caldiplasma sukawensis]
MKLTAVEKAFNLITGEIKRQGEYVWASPHTIHMHDVLGPLVKKIIKEQNIDTLKFRGRKIVVIDHIYPPKDPESANNIISMKNFAEEYGFEIFGNGDGIEHTLLIENGVIGKDEIVAGTDSHTVTAGAAGSFGIGLGSTDMAFLLIHGKTWFRIPETMRVHLSGKPGKYTEGKDIILEILKRIGTSGANYMSMEFVSDNDISLDDRLSIANMTVEAGAKTCIFPQSEVYESDEDAIFKKEMEIDVNQIEPVVSVPYSPGNVKSLSEVRGTKIDKVYIGNCSNGTLSDMRRVYEILKGNHVKKNIEMTIVPATRSIYLESLKRGYIETFIEAGATVLPPNCGACAGLHMGVLGKGQVCIANINRNFRGRMGDPNSQVYISNTRVAAMSAVLGEIPGDVDE